MKRVIIIGCPGSGKSHFSRALAEYVPLPLYHLDMLYWKPDRTTVSKEVFRERLDEVLSKETWIIDGNYGSTMEMRISQCDTVFFFDLPLEVCLAGVRERIGRTRPDMPWIEQIEDEEFIQYIKDFGEHSRPKILELLEKYPDKKVWHFTSRRSADAFISRIGIQSELLSMRDEKYKQFSSKLTPSVDPNSMIGIRIPALRQYAKRLARDGRADAFLELLPHEYFEENNLHAFLIEQIADVDICIREIDRFLPYIHNWATCDSLRPKCLVKHTDALLTKIFEWLDSPHEYAVRFAIECLMLYFLGDNFDTSHLERVANIDREEYYIKMMVAWYFATALAKQWDQTLCFITEHRLDPWTHAKTVKKACESYRLTDRQKQILRQFR